MKDDVLYWYTTSTGIHIPVKAGETKKQALVNKINELNKKSNKSTKEERAEQSVILKNKREDLREKLRKGNFKEEEYNDIKQKIKELTEQKKELDKDLNDEDLKNARHRLEEKEYEEKQPKLDLKKEEKQFNNLMKDEFDNIKKELSNELKNVENYEENYGIEEQVINETKTKTMKKIENMYESGKISDYVYDRYIEKINEETSNIMSEKGYEAYERNGKSYYSMLPKAKKTYNEILNELDERNLKYKISKSWVPGELPSIYIEDEEGNQFRIANHYNEKNQQFKAYSLKENKIYSTKDYINYKDTILSDLDKWIKENNDNYISNKLKNKTPKQKAKAIDKLNKE